jgi:hypothetical protein
MKKNNNSKTFNVLVEFDNEFDLVHKFLRIYLMSLECKFDSDKFHIRNKLVEVLTFYVLKGFSDSTKKLIMGSVSPEITYHNLNQINSELTRKNLLLRSSGGDNNWKNTYRELSPTLVKLRDYILNKDYDNLSALLVGFKQR